MDIGGVILLGTLAIMACWWIFSETVFPRLKTSPPTEKILDLVRREEGFSIRIANKDELLKDFLADYAIVDVVTGAKTVLSRVPFGGTIHLEGDLEWMNQYEAERLYCAVGKVIDTRQEKYREACRIEKAARDERDRNRAKEIYKNR